MAKQIYQIHIELKNSKPKIWRRLLVDSNIFLEELHDVIQIVMGWEDAHLHCFYDGMNQYAPKEFQLEESIESKKVRLNRLLISIKSKITYEYDFGDEWIHVITLEKVLEPDNKLQLPKCIGGKLNSPPEDCGGIWGYYNMLEIIKDPDHDEHEDIMEWLDDDFDPEYFDMDEINEYLK